MFEKYGKPTWYLDRHIYTFPLHMALKFNTMLLVYGENVSFEYGGCEDEETYSARGQIENGVGLFAQLKADFDFAMEGENACTYWQSSIFGLILQHINNHR